MFKRSKPQTSPSLFHSWQSQLTGRKLVILTDPMAWHNVFKNQITTRIDERPFSVLYDHKMGRGNAPIRLLVAMNILKEGHGWSDQQLFEQCAFNILVMNALGLSNVDDQIPVESTWYLFRQKLYQYHTNEGRDLTGECFAQLTKDQSEFFGVSGQKLRMDSKLIGSNIVTSSRLQLVINCLQAFYKQLKDEQKLRLVDEDRLKLEELSSKKSGNIVYRLTPDEQRVYMHQLGELLVRLVEEFNDEENDKHGLINRVLNEQYSIIQEVVEIKANNKITSNSIQSVHDLESSFRKKGKQKVQGYSVNVSETCNDQGLNLVTDIKVEKATCSDVNFVEQAIQETQKIVGPVAEAYMDGAYNSIEHINKMKDTTFYFTGITGSKGRFTYKWNGKMLIAIDTKTNIEHETKRTKAGKYRIQFEHEGEKVLRYINPEAVACHFRRVEIEQLPEAILNKRSNVEATIFQLCYLTRNNKTRYRGLFKHQLWAELRALWMNVKRIQLYLMGEDCPQAIKQRILAITNGFLDAILLLKDQCEWKMRKIRSLLRSLEILTDIKPQLITFN